MSDTAQLHERLLEVERTARDVSDSMQNGYSDELDALRAALERIDSTRDAIRARQKLEGRWVG